MSGQEIVPTLRRNVGRKSMHHASFVMFASTGLKMLSLVQKRIAKPNQEILEFGKTGKYSVMPMNRVMKHKLSGLITFGRLAGGSGPFHAGHSEPTPRAWMLGHLPWDMGDPVRVDLPHAAARHSKLEGRERRHSA